MLEFLLAAAVELNSVHSVDYVQLHAREALVRIELGRPLAQRPSGYRTFHPAARVVLDLPDTFLPSDAYEVVPEGRVLLVTLRRTAPAPPIDRWQRFGAAPQHLLRDLRFERGSHGEARVLVDAAPASGIDVRQEGRRLIVSFRDTGVDPSAERRLDVMDFATPVEAIEARSAGRDALLVVQTSGSFEYSARQVDTAFILTVAPGRREP